MYGENFPPAVVNWPPAYRSLPDTTKAPTMGRKPEGSPMPEPSAVQLLPSHLAMELAALPPAVLNLPPAYRSLPDTASANTAPRNPEPTAVKLSAHHLAPDTSALPTPAVTSTPAYTSLPDTARADTAAIMPEAST